MSENAGGDKFVYFLAGAGLVRYSPFYLRQSLAVRLVSCLRAPPTTAETI